MQIFYDWWVLKLVWQEFMQSCKFTKKHVFCMTACFLRDKLEIKKREGCESMQRALHAWLAFCLKQFSISCHNQLGLDAKADYFNCMLNKKQVWS